MAKRLGDIYSQRPKLGSGERFDMLSKRLKAKGADNPEALDAWIGRKKYGKERYGRLSRMGT